MKYTTHELQQGTPEWLAYRANTLNASDAGTALGINPYKSRADLIRELATGITIEVDSGTQRRFDDGHRFERLARQISEKIVGEDMSPVTVSRSIDGLKRRLSASLDGASFGDTDNWEHKTLSESLAAALDRGEIPAQYHPQMEQGMMINGATRCLFMASKWDSNDQLIDEKHVWYESNPELRTKIIAAWKQVEADIDGYTHTEPAPAAVAAPITDLPALAIEISGSVVASNLAQWKDVVTERIASIKTDLHTDSDFADAEATVKFLDDGEKKIDLVRSQAQAQAVDIDAVFRALDEIKASMRSKRLELDKLVKARKDAVRMEIMQDGLTKLSEHAGQLNKRLGAHYIKAEANFAGVMKGKRTVASLRDAVDTELAQAKIAASALADKIQINLIALAAVGSHAFLFNDKAALVLKDADDLALIIRTRIADHHAAEEKRLHDAIQSMQQKANEDAATIRAAEAIRNGAAPAARPVATAAQSFQSAAVAQAMPIDIMLRDKIDAALAKCTTAELEQIVEFIFDLAANRSIAA